MIVVGIAAGVGGFVLGALVGIFLFVRLGSY